MPPKTQSSDEITRMANGEPVLRSNLLPYTFAGNIVVADRHTGTILCQLLQETWGYVSHPVFFGNRHRAMRWIESGTIGDLQEELTSLEVGFCDKLVKELPWRRRQE